MEIKIEARWIPKEVNQFALNMKRDSGGVRVTKKAFWSIRSEYKVESVVLK